MCSSSGAISQTTEIIQGRKTELIGKIQDKYGAARDEAERQVDDWRQNLES
jgi:uncharacterized protein YjbJ (UPF0337 family)